ncbi:polysaccharide pyruvyl transferase family protein [[Clostridium] fimetarium]|uniref:Polysaccharide pyruvyl transferase family protein WcaK n=1 Tax=[Clostridium] fimetarium TaxID=99656 RepID=A0A1I0RLL8_9FIRM|nr:polysaccharide pyruvyl transferase family protein [[Clostridium] fimetarium]SEW41998.1 Polysaccharide pyruvyl transferase family protein WcaK [[Clostridium] fimetarium]
MNKIYLPSHKDGDNRGCEAITRGTIAILNGLPESIIGYSNNLEVDKKLGLSKLFDLRAMPTYSDESIVSKMVFILKRILLRNNKTRHIYKAGHLYEYIMKEMDSGDLVLSTGGDMLCYENNEIIYINNYLSKKHVKTILWGCSIGYDNLTPEKIYTLKKFSFITVRESLTKQMLEEKLGLDNVELYPDPAFVLESKTCTLPDYMYKKKVCGINLSNFVGKDVSFDTVFGKNLLHLINYILSDTSLDVVFIPHVFWQGQDDRIVCKALFEKFKETERIHLFNSENLNYCEIRYAVSKCQFFIGTRTHAMISAYSMCVPALALGYSVKARGIAKDLGMPTELVVDYQSIKDLDELIIAFKYMYDNEDVIRKHLEDNIPNYSAKAFEAKSVVERLYTPNITKKNR